MKDRKEWKAGPRRSAAEKSAHRDFIYRALLKGWTMTRIAQEIGLSIAQVSKDTKIVRKKWEKRTERNIKALEEMELDKIKLVEEQAWNAWDKSLQDQRVRIIKGKSKTDAFAEQRITDGIGNPRFLEVVLKACQDRRQILGIPDNQEIQQETIEAMSQAMLTAYNEMAKIEGLIKEDAPTGLALPRKPNGKSDTADMNDEQV